jgi:hypothetical protein
MRDITRRARNGAIFGAVALALLAMAGCDDGGGGKGATRVIAASGDHVDLTATVWAICYAGSPDTYEVHSFSDDGLDVIVEGFDTASSDGSCDLSTKDQSFQSDYVLDKRKDVTLASWTNGTKTTSAPKALDGTTALPDPPEASQIEATAGGEAGLFYSLFVDDTGTPRRLYRTNSVPADPCAPPAGGADQCLNTQDYLEEVE